METLPFYTDAIGQRVEPGDIIAYIHRSGQYFKFGKVVKIYKKTIRYHSEPTIHVQIIGMNEKWDRKTVEKFYKASLVATEYQIKLHYWNKDNIQKLASQQI
jgi:hypothetical protein